MHVLLFFFFLCHFSRRNVLGMTQFASAKKSKDSEPLVSFLPRLLVEPGLVLNFSATALRNSVVRVVWLPPGSGHPSLGAHSARVFIPRDWF